MKLAARGKSTCFGKMGTGSNFRHPQLLQNVTSGGAEIRACTRFFPQTTFRHGLLGVIAGLCVASGLFAQSPNPDPVQWSLSSDTAKAPPGSTVTLRLTAKIDSGWHLYSLTKIPDIIPTTVNFADTPAVDSFEVQQPKPIVKNEPLLGHDVEMYFDQAVFLVQAHLKQDAAPGELPVTANVRYTVCNDKTCKPPKKKTASFNLIVDPAAPVPVVSSVPTPPPSKAPSQGGAPAQSLSAFLLLAFGAGLLAVFTPCVFPMIPITVSFFLNQRGGILQAVVFSLGIVTLFCALGFGVTAAVGPFGVSQLASNPWVNGFIAVVFCTFALSLLGAFEITLPSAMLTKLDSASRRGGYVGTLLMGLTFSLSSFACVGPLVGSLLVSSAQSKGLQPVLGMAGFAAGLASPFFFLAAFPSYLTKLPKSGGWLMRVKVVMGFVLLAFLFKYLSNIDEVLQLGFLTRDRVLAAWLVLIAMPGLYLLGLLRMEGVEVHERLGIGRLLTACAFLIFAFTLLPGMFGARLGWIDSYLPPASDSGAGGGSAAAARPAWIKDDLPKALAQAKAENKLVLLNFSGYSCTNCKWMDANVFPRPEIMDAVKDLVPVELFIDGTDKASEDNGKFEEDHFKVASMPYYALIDADQNIVAVFGDRATDPQQFLTFLKTKPGLKTQVVLKRSPGA
jgi:thiol:disulfide interchange protein